MSKIWTNKSAIKALSSYKPCIFIIYYQQLDISKHKDLLYYFFVCISLSKIIYKVNEVQTVHENFKIKKHITVYEQLFIKKSFKYTFVYKYISFVKHISYQNINQTTSAVPQEVH